MATLLPRGKQQFIDATGAPLVGGKVYHYIPGTTTAKDTYQDANSTILNTNPIILDGRGEAVIYGTGAYRQLVKDSLDNTIWDQLTADTSSTNNIWGGTSTGTANAQTVLAGNFSSQSGQTITFLAGYTNSESLTVNSIPVVKDTGAGPINLTGGEVTANNTVTLVYEATAGKFHLSSAAINTSSYLTAANNLSDLASAATSRTNLGLGTAATLNVGTSLNNIVQLDASAKLPAVDGSQLTNLPAAPILSPTTSVVTTMSTATALIPNDDTIPQITEGTEIVTISVTTTNNTQRVRLRYSGMVAQSAGSNTLIVALFVDSTANALAATAVPAVGVVGTTATLDKIVSPGAAGTYTYRIRIGPSVAATLTINGASSARLYGGVAAQQLVAEVLN